MKALRIIVISLFLVVSAVFGAVFVRDWLTADRTAPQIVCDGKPLEVSVRAGDRELCAGLTATDDRDGDLTDAIIVRRGAQLIGANSAIVHYAVFDSASNYCTYSRAVYYTDYCKPRFQLTAPLIYNVSSVISLSERLTATDVIDGDLSGRIRVSAAALSNAQPGEYPISVQVTNSSGDTSIARLIVQVQNVTPQHPVIELSDYLIYVKEGEDFPASALRDYVAAARSSSKGNAVKPAQLTVDGAVDTAVLGSQFIRYSYTNDQGLTYTAILTVIVE